MLEILKTYGVGRRKLDDPLFSSEEPPPRYGIYDLDDEELCHQIIRSPCNIPGCPFVANSLLEAENHYNATHRYSCSQCKKMLPSPHFLDLHIEENHDSYFAVMSLRKPSYACYIEECKEKFMNPEERLDHCVKLHKLPKDFRFDQKPKSAKKVKIKTNKMEVDTGHSSHDQKFVFTNSKRKSFPKYTGKKFHETEESAAKDINMDDIVSDLKESLPN